MESGGSTVNSRQNNTSTLHRRRRITFDDLQLPYGRRHLLQLLGEIVGEVEQYLAPEESRFDLGSVLVDLGFDQRERMDETIGALRDGGTISDHMTSLGFDGDSLALFFPSLRTGTDRGTDR